MSLPRLCSLVIVALIAVILWSTPAGALDHPWDGTKLTDTAFVSSSGPNGDPTDGNTDDGQESVSKNWYGWFSNWLNGLFGGNDVEKNEEEHKSRETDSKSRKNDLTQKKLFRR
ncbi:MAG: hypothetical protein GF310_06425 [candidate division Zixibacteria bacterium]|nr:hypothetical protein [candidate division Zixibacteria bacterium]